MSKFSDAKVGTTHDQQRVIQLEKRWKTQRIKQKLQKVKDEGLLP